MIVLTRNDAKEAALKAVESSINHNSAMRVLAMVWFWCNFREVGNDRFVYEPDVDASPSDILSFLCECLDTYFHDEAELREFLEENKVIFEEVPDDGE